MTSVKMRTMGDGRRPSRSILIQAVVFFAAAVVVGLLAFARADETALQVVLGIGLACCGFMLVVSCVALKKMWPAGGSGD